MRRIRTIGLGAVIAVVASAPRLAGAAGQAEEPSLNLAVRIGLRTTGLMTGAGGIGLGASWRSRRYLGIDGSLGFERFSQEHTGTSIELLARGFSGLGTHVVSLGLGPSLRTARDYGPIAFATGELAYELRPGRGLSLLIGGGVEVPLNDSGTATCTAPGFLGCLFGAKASYHAGEVLPRLRVAAGIAF